MRRLLLIIGLLFPCAAGADDQSSRALDVFLKICSAVVDEKPDIQSLAASLGFTPSRENAIRATLGNTVTSTYEFDNGPRISVSRTTYYDATETHCTTFGKIDLNTAELGKLMDWLKLGNFDGDSGQGALGLVATGSWKRKGNNPLIFFSLSRVASQSNLTMRRIELFGVPLDQSRK
jgi:hypothetical protein